MNKEILKNNGIDYDNGVARFMGESEIYEEVLQTFLEMPSLDNAITYFEAKDYPNLFAVIHDVKGSSGNCDMTALFQESSVLCDLLRTGVYDEQKIASSFEKFRKIYSNTAEAIRAAI